MLVDLVRFKTKDKVELAGFLVGQKTAGRAILYVHGLGSNFYKSARTDALAQFFEKVGWAFLSFNNRGADGKADSEDFKKCVYDISAAVNFIRRRGVREIVLIGHSTGCNKIIYALAKKKLPGVRGVILLAGLSDPDIYKSELGRKYGKLLKQAERLVRTGKEEKYLLVESGKHGAMTAGRIVSLMKYGEAEDLFSASLGKKAKARYHGLTMPTLIVYGTADEHAHYNVKKIGQFVAAQIPGPVSQVYIKRASHGFKGYEQQLMEHIVKWLTQHEHIT